MLFQEFLEVPRSAVLSNIIGEEKNKHLKTKQNNSKGADSLCSNYSHSYICFCILRITEKQILMFTNDLTHMKTVLE